MFSLMWVRSDSKRSLECWGRRKYTVELAVRLLDVDDLLIIDDAFRTGCPFETALESAYECIHPGPRQRLQPGGSIVIVMTRWSLKDLTGKLIKAQTHDPPIG